MLDKREVGGSSPLVPTNLILTDVDARHMGRIAQVVFANRVRSERTPDKREVGVRWLA